MRVVAIDQGTTSTRAFVPDGAGGRVVCQRTHRQHHPRAGWVEHDPEELLAHIHECLEQAGQVETVGLANQGESCLAWDAETGRPLTPVIVWQDQRTAQAVQRLKDDGHEEETLARAGLPLDPYFSASKLAWIVENRPEARDLLGQGRLCLGTTDAFFLHRLTGRFVTDITTASRTSLMNLESGAWDERLCAMFGVPMEALPEIVPTMGALGTLRLGGRDVPITASVVDQQAALFGHGCRNPGDAKITFGTGAFALAIAGNTPPRRTAGGLLPTVAWQATGGPATWALDGGVYCAGSAVNWARSLGLFSNFVEIDSFAAPPAIERGLVFVPALAGLACPHWDRAAGGMWIGLSLETTAQDMMQALLEGIALRACEVVDTLAARAPVPDTISIDGGLSSNPYFCQFLADALQKRITVPAVQELTALGAAQMAACGAGLGAETGTVAPGRSHAPGPARPAWKARFAEAIRRASGWKGACAQGL